MSAYLVGDLHGDFKHFKKLLKKIDFNENSDKIYILGDVLDRGSDGIKMLNFINHHAKNGSMYLLKGNHEFFAQMYLEGKLSSKQWQKWGGAPTLKEISDLSRDEKAELAAYLRGLPHFLELSLWGRDCVLTHSGLCFDFLVENDDKIDVCASIKKALDFDEFEFLCSNDLHYLAKSELKKLDKYLIVGHTPTFKLDENDLSYIVKNDYYIDLDSGAGYRHKGGKVSALRIDDKKEFYI